jgi:tetratricopeptide (TPR) repeat protein
MGVMDGSEHHVAAGEALSAGEGAVPHRAHVRRSGDAPGRPGSQPDPVVRLVRTILAVVVSVGLMLVVLVGAMKYLQRDWADKNQRARSHRRAVPASADGKGDASAAEAEKGRDGGRPYSVPSAVCGRFADSLAGTGAMPHLWLLSGREPAEERRGMLLDLAANGDGAAFRNLHAALLLKRGRVLEAVGELRTAERIEAGYPPTIFNRALCAMMTDLPDQAQSWIARYRARFPQDEQAMRFQFNLLLQTDRPELAMDLLDRFLASQPPSQPLYLEAALQAARMNRVGDAIRYLETARQGQPAVVIARIFQSPAFREIRLAPEGTVFAERLARKARASLARAATARSPSASAETPVSARMPVNPKFH